MVTATLDGKAFLVHLPPDCLSVAQAASYAKQQLGAAWADACTPPSHGYTHGLIFLDDRPLRSLASVERNMSGDPTSKKRLFLSAKSWQLGGMVADDAHLLAFGEKAAAEAPTADELPASLLLGGLLQLRTFSAQHAQVTVNLPDGRSINTAVFDSMRGADLIAHVATLLRWDPARVRLRRERGGELLREADPVIPGTRLDANVFAGPGPGMLEIFVSTLTGKTMTFHLIPDSTIGELMQAIDDLEGIPVDEQRVIFEKQWLKYDCTLAAYQIGDGTTLQLLQRFRGGMFALSSGRCGDFRELGLGSSEHKVAAIAAAGRIPLEVVLPNGSSVLLSCSEQDGRQEVLAALREHLLLGADVDGLQDTAAMRGMLRQARVFLRARRPWRC